MADRGKRAGDGQVFTCPTKIGAEGEQPEDEQGEQPKEDGGALATVAKGRSNANDCQNRQRVAKIDVLCFVIGEGQRCDPIAKPGVQTRRNQVAHQVGAENVGETTAAGKEVALAAHVGQDGGEKGRYAHHKD